MTLALVLCEGKVDAALISHWLEKRRNFLLDPWPGRREPVRLNVALQHTYKAWLAKQGADTYSTFVFGVGGFSQLLPVLGKALEALRAAPRGDSNEILAFERIVVVWDCDESDPGERKERLVEYLQSLCESPYPSCTLGRWSKWSLKQELRREDRTVDFLPIQFPQERRGCLESELHRALQEFGGDFATIASAADTFVNAVQSTSFVSTQSAREKARLGADMAAIAPDWSLAAAFQRIGQIDWTSSRPLQMLLSGLDEL